MGLRPIDLLWAYAKGGIKGLHIPTAYRYAESVRFMPDQVAAAIQSGVIHSLPAKHAPFSGHEDDPWPEWFVEPFEEESLYAAGPVTIKYEINPYDLFPVTEVRALIGKLFDE